MSRNKTITQNHPGYILSRSTYKKLGTILEHLTEVVNPAFFEIHVSFSHQPKFTVIRIHPRCDYNNLFPLAVWELVWTDYFNSKIYINPALLIPGAEW